MFTKKSIRVMVMSVSVIVIGVRQAKYYFQNLNVDSSKVVECSFDCQVTSHRKGVQEY